MFYNILTNQSATSPIWLIASRPHSLGEHQYTDAATQFYGHGSLKTTSIHWRPNDDYLADPTDKTTNKKPIRITPTCYNSLSSEVNNNANTELYGRSQKSLTVYI